MAFNKSFLGVLAHGTFSGTLWEYYTADALATVDTAGYFNDASADLRVGDVILVKVVNDTAAVATRSFTMTAWGMVGVNANSGGVVDVSDNLLAATADTD